MALGFDGLAECGWGAVVARRSASQGEWSGPEWRFWDRAGCNIGTLAAKAVLDLLRRKTRIFLPFTGKQIRVVHVLSYFHSE